MIEAARALRDQAEAEAQRHEVELDRLRALVDQLNAFIDQPMSHAEAVRNGSRTSADQAEERGFDSRPPLHDQPVVEPAVSTAQNAEPSATPASFTCPKCGKEGFQKPNSLAMHVKHCDGVGTQRVRPRAVDVVRLAERNPRSVPPLDLPARVDRAVGE